MADDAVQLFAATFHKPNVIVVDTKKTGSFFVVSVPAEKKQAFEEHFKSHAQRLGTVTASANIEWQFAQESVTTSVKDLQTIWAQGVQNVYQA